MTSRFLAAACATAALAAAGGCAADAAGPRATGASPAVAPAATAATPAPSRAPAGVGASAARARGVFSAPYDAALRGPSAATAGRITLRLVNVGTKADTYRIGVRPAGAATLSARTASLASGAAATLDLQLTADASVHVVSTGRGAEVASLPVRLG